MMGGLGLIVGIGLAIASKIFYVYVDPLIIAVEEVLPGANCGGCGFPGCSSNAEAIVAGKSSPSSCVAGSADLAGIIAGIMGVSVEAKEPDIALPGCTYGTEIAATKFTYEGIYDCRAASMINGGMKVCTIGCLGLGTCVRACPFNALSMGPEGLPVVDQEKCTGCGTCERACPKHIIRLSSVTRRILREYTDEECTTPCQRACPAGINISEYIRQIALGDYHKAVQVIKERNPFPAVIGRICPRPCEDHCRRRYVDEPVTINYLKRFAADYEIQTGERIQPFTAPDTHRKTAVIGGGVEGLSTAFFTRRLGHDTTVFEATEKLGGMLRSAIAPNRLPENILDWDIEGVKDIGVKFETGKRLGKNISLNSLFKDGFETVFIASGGWDSRQIYAPMNEPATPVVGVYLMLEYVRFIMSGGKIPSGENAVVLGGGKKGLETAKLLKNGGAKTVTVIYRDTVENCFGESCKSINDEIIALEKEGVSVIFKGAIENFEGVEDKLTHLSYVDMLTGESHRIPMNTIVISAGRFPEMVFARRKDEKGEFLPGDSIGWEGIPVYKKPANLNEKGIFAPGDAVTDFRAAIKAIAAGRRAAASIHQIIYGQAPFVARNAVTIDSDIQNVDHVEDVAKAPRNIMPIADAKELAETGQLEKGFSEETAKNEAERCLQCGLICYAKTDITFNTDDVEEKMAV